MNPPLELVGKQFSKWTVLRYVGYSRSEWQHRWRCRCQCGRESDVSQYSLLHGRSFGCRFCVPRPIKHGFGRRTNRPPEYGVWAAMLQRCNNPKCHAYSYYGGRGIKVSERWEMFENFLEDMGPRPNGHTLDRIDNNGNYEPSNCRWTPMSKQLRNTRRTRMFSLDGETMCLKDWAKRYGVNQQMIAYRLRRGWPLEAAVKYPPGQRL